MIIFLDNNLKNFYKNKCPLSMNYCKMTIDELIKEDNLQTIHDKIYQYINNLKVIVDSENEKYMIDIENNSYQLLNLARINRKYLPENILYVYVRRLLKEYTMYKSKYRKNLYLHMTPDYEYDIINYLIEKSSINLNCIEELGCYLIKFCSRKMQSHLKLEFDIHFGCFKKFIDCNLLQNNKNLRCFMLQCITTQIPHINFSEKDIESLYYRYFDNKNNSDDDWHF